LKSWPGLPQSRGKTLSEQLRNASFAVYSLKPGWKRILEMIDLTRREAITVMCAAAGAVLAPNILGAAAQDSNSTGTPWYSNVRRCGAVQFNERDPLEMDVSWWIDYWTSLKVDALRLNAGGIMAFYPTRIPYQHRSRFLGNRDLFGDFTKAAKAKGIRVMARLDPNLVYEDASKAHPEWIARSKNGDPLKPANGLYATCMYSTYFTGQIPAIISEINSMYDVDGFFTNGFPAAGRPKMCYCEACENSSPGEPDSPAAYQRHMARVLEIWRLWDQTAKQKKPDSLYVGNLGSGIGAVSNLHDMAVAAAWISNDHQGRAGDAPVWDCAQQGRVSRCVMKGRATTIVCGAYSTTRPLWRHTSKAPLEAKMWMAQGTASGMAPLLHWLGGGPKDLRWMETGRSFYQWIAKNEEHFVYESSVANLAIVWSQSTNAFYKGPGRGETTDYLQGMYQVMLEGRFFFDLVHEDDLTADTLAKYKGLILANAAVLSDKQCQQLRDYVSRGGSLLATFETGFYDQNGNPRSDSGLADFFGFQKKAAVVGSDGSNAVYMNVERDHAILQGFSHTTLLPLSEYYVPLRSIPDPVLTVLPPFPGFPPELVYPPVGHTDEPAVVLAERGTSRLVFLPGDIDRSYWHSQNPDLSRILINAIRWMCPEAPLTVTGDGLAEVIAWKTKPGFAVHILNYTNPQTLRGTYTEPYPLGPLTVRMTLPAGSNASKVHLLARDTMLPATRSDTTIEFTVPEVRDYEVATIV
jgi:Hypothetical glycosyl hydrolase 6/Trehalose utilisation